ncbi:ribonuclease R, partial [Mycoplasmopsis pullorum]
NEDRFVMSCVMEIDPKGNTVKTNIFPGIINSKYRLTYKQVNNFLEHNDDSVIKDSQLQKMLLDSYELSKILHNFKINQGYIDFEISEPKIILNEDGSVKDIKIEERGVSEVLIEDFMVRANEEVAIFLSKLKLPVMYRVHDVPDAEKINSLKTVLNALKINDININEVDLTPKKFAECTEIIKSKRDDEFIKLMFLRTMQKAKYSGDNIGHFGLASDCYCHFTSPIRRYPDLVVHRIIRDFVFNKENHKLNEMKEKLESIAI